MKTTTEFETEIRDMDGKTWSVHATGTCYFDKQTPGVDARWDEPLYRMTGFRVIDMTFTDPISENAFQLESLASLPDMFSNENQDWIESRASEALSEKLGELEEDYYEY